MLTRRRRNIFCRLLLYFSIFILFYYFITIFLFTDHAETNPNIKSDSEAKNADFINVNRRAIDDSRNNHSTLQPNLSKTVINFHMQNLQPKLNFHENDEVSQNLSIKAESIIKASSNSNSGIVEDIIRPNVISKNIELANNLDLQLNKDSDSNSLNQNQKIEISKPFYPDVYTTIDITKIRKAISEINFLKKIYNTEKFQRDENVDPVIIIQVHSRYDFFAVLLDSLRVEWVYVP